MEPTIQEETYLEDRNHDSTCNKCRRLSSNQECFADQRERRSFSSSIQGITGTAKRFIKHASLGQLRRIRSRSSLTVSSGADKQSEYQDVHAWASCNGMSQPAELSCDPLYHQLEDNQRTSMQSDDFRPLMPAFADDHKSLPTFNHEADQKSHDASDLSSKSLPCDNCEQPIRGGDLYDFCALCRPSDRILCINCARQRKCWRHRSDEFCPDDVPSARNSPAPPYTRPEVNVNAQQRDTQAQSDSIAQDIDSDDHHVENDFNVKADRMDRMTLEAKKVLHTLKKMADQQEPSHVSHRERSLREKEASLRDQFATVREERSALKEQELLIREREQLSRDRDALVIRNLQTLVTIQELSRNGFIGAQFSSMKKDDGERPHFDEKPLGRSKSQWSHDGILLDDRDREHQPKATVSKVVAQAEATIKEFSLDDKNIRTVPGQKRKKEGNPAPSASVSPSNSHGAGQAHISGYHRDRPPSEDDEDDEEESTPPKKQKSDPADPDSPQRIYACPYSKHDRVRYSPRNMSERHYRGCAGHFLHDIPRLKQHLRRVHWRPEHHCERCFKVFSSPAQLTEHFGQDRGCSRKECPFPEKMDKAQRQQIHVKRPRVPAENLWYDIYKVLFPGSPLPESPYFEEEEEITPPTSATPSSASPEEATQRMIQIFNDRLDKHKNNPEYGWLSSSVLRTLINSEIAESMSELFGTLTVDPCTAQGLTNSQAPSTTVSPVTSPPLASSVKSSSPQTSQNAVSLPTLPTPLCRPHQKAPILKEPKPRRAPIFHGDEMRYYPQISNNVPVDRLPHLAAMQRPSFQGPDQSGYVGPQMGDCTMVDFPFTAPIDEGWDEQSGSYQQGDDRAAMETMVIDYSASASRANNINSMEPVRPRKPPTFVPVRLGALKEPTPEQSSGAPLLQANKSIGSLVDSGYGSGNSLHPGLRVPLEDEQTEFSNDISPIGHTTFDEELRLLQSGIAYNNPWQRGDDLTYFE